MKIRAAWAAAALWATFVGVLVWALSAGTSPETGDPIHFSDAIWACSLIGFPTAGAVIAGRLPRNPLGWILLVTSIVFILGVGAQDQAQILVHQGAIGAAQAFALVAVGTLSIAMGLAIFIPLLIPDGRLPGRRWRYLAWAGVGVSFFFLLRNLFVLQTFVDIQPRLTNPWATPAAEPIANALNGAAGIVYEVIFLAALASVVFRYRRAAGVQKQQLRWVAFGALFVVACFFAAGLMSVAGVSESNPFGLTIVILAPLALPLSIAIAVLRYRLFEIDRLVNKTIVYAILTAVLGGVYLGAVVGLQALLASVTASSDLAIAASTLAVAGLFGPVRRRIQQFIDRRFYRRRFDAAKTVEVFSSHLRDEIDLQELSSDLVAVVRDTMEPAHVSLWLRTPGEVT